MSQPIDEQLSAFMDGELGRDEARFLLKRVEGDAQLAGRWTRYHIARQALRKQDIVVLRTDFTAGVMARLDAEAAPQAVRNVWLRWGSGGAIAAAVAVAALMVTKPSTAPDTGSAAVAAANSSVVPAARPAQSPVQLASTNPSDSRPTALVPNSPALNMPIQTAAASFGTDVVQPGSFDPRLQSYVIRHYQATGSTGQPDFVPYILLMPSAQTAQTAAEPRQAENR